MPWGSWQDTSCRNCGAVIHYHISWINIPDLCRDCIAIKRAERAKWHEKSCTNCGTVIRYHQDWLRVPDMCRECIAAKRAKWQEKSCASCGTTIRYHLDWTNIPTYCKTCGQWLNRPCSAQGCWSTIQYKKYWTRVPVYCRPCKNGERSVHEIRPRPDGGYDKYEGWGYVNRNGVIVFVDNGPHGKHSHAVYDASGNLLRERQEGHFRPMENKEWQETTCTRCGGSFTYSVKWHTIPKLCKGCLENEPRLAKHIETGMMGEHAAHAIARNQFGFQTTGYEQGSHGIDGIYKDEDGNIVIMESKSERGYGPSKLTNNQQIGRQMDEPWIRYHAGNMAKSSGANKALGEEILSRLNSNNRSTVRRILIQTDPRSGYGLACYEAFDWNNHSWTEIEPTDG